MKSQGNERILLFTVLLVAFVANSCVFAFCTIQTQLAFNGLLLTSILVANLSFIGWSLSNQATRNELFEVIFKLARNECIANIHHEIATSLAQVGKHRDDIFLNLAQTRLRIISQEIQQIGKGRVEFQGTESWRVFYEKILLSQGIHLYCSVAHIESVHYWQDGPGIRSTRLNHQISQKGISRIERVCIIGDHIWPEYEQFPIEPVRVWLDDQFRCGIELALVRESVLSAEPELITDFGIYGNRAVGRQISDSTGRTSRFLLSFDFADVEEAEKLWKRISTFSKSYKDLLDQNC